MARLLDIDTYFAAQTREHLAVATALASDLGAPFRSMFALWDATLRGGGKIMLFGNGGSAADSQHLATELVVRFRRNRPSLAAIALTTDCSALTASANDFGIEHMFSRQIEALGRPGDLAVAITTSGTSANVVAAIESARSLGLRTAALTGGTGGAIAGQVDVCLLVPSHDTARIQEMHILLGHMLCGALEESRVAEPSANPTTKVIAS